MRVPRSTASVPFQVLLRSSSDGRIATTANIDAFRVDPERAERVRRWLHAHGVTAHVTDFAIAASAPPKVFASLFGVQPKRASSGAASDAWVLPEVPRVPAEIAEVVAEVTIAPQPEFF